MENGFMRTVHPFPQYIARKGIMRYMLTCGSLLHKYIAIYCCGKNKGVLVQGASVEKG